MGRWIGRRKGWLARYGHDKKEGQNEAKKEDGNYAVIYYAVKCPKCKSKNVKRYKSNLPVRYHKCRNCGLNFKSIEEG